MSEAEMHIEPVAPASKASEELYLGDAIHFFLSAKRAGGRSQKTIDDYRKKLELFQRWVASRYGGKDSEAVDAPYSYRSRPGRIIRGLPQGRARHGRLLQEESPRSPEELLPDALKKTRGS